MSADELLFTAMSLNSSQETFPSSSQTTIDTSGNNEHKTNEHKIVTNKDIIDVDQIFEGMDKNNHSSSSSSQSSTSYSYVNPNLKTAVNPKAGLTNEQQDKLQEFQDVTGTDADTAIHILEVLLSPFFVF